jgi:hypothetical protein
MRGSGGLGGCRWGVASTRVGLDGADVEGGFGAFEGAPGDEVVVGGMENVFGGEWAVGEEALEEVLGELEKKIPVQ